MKICHLTSAHQRYDTRIFIKECQSLAKAGHKVSLIVADGKDNEIKNNVYIYDVGKRVGRLKRMFLSSRDVYNKALAIDADVYHFHDPELIWAGWFLLGRGKKVIYDIHEDLSKQILFKYWLPVLFRKPMAFIFKAIEDFVCKRYTGLVVPQPTMEKEFSKHNKNIILIANFVRKDLMLIKQPKEIIFDRLLYCGVLSEERGLFLMLEIAERLEKKDIKLILAGKIQEHLLERAKSHNGWRNTSFLGLLPYDEALKLYTGNVLGLNLFLNEGQYHLAYSIKSFEYMLNGIPFLMPDFGEWVEFNEINKCGINVDTSNSKAVTKIILELKNDKARFNALSKNGFEAALVKYTWESQAHKLLKFYNKINDTVS
jgi:glycosyltransferase involved in cell wall biosynthesis